MPVRFCKHGCIGLFRIQGVHGFVGRVTEVDFGSGRVLIATSRAVIAIAACVPGGVWAGPSLSNVFSPQIFSSSAQQTIYFPVARNGDANYDVVLTYRTVDVSAFADIDYAAVDTSAVVVASAPGIFLPVTIYPASGSDQTKTFQLLVAAAGIGPPPNFTAQQTFSIVHSPYSIAAADLNGDGKQDLISADSRSIGAGVSVAFNATTPGSDVATFGAQQMFATGSGPYAIAVSDINGDGRPDLIAANSVDGTVSVMLNTASPGAATPAFSAQQTFATGAGPSALASADLNGDGKPDLAVASAMSNTVSVLLNITATGADVPTFAGSADFATGSIPASVATADINGDGKPDLIVANVADDAVSVLLNTTSPGAIVPSFSMQQVFATGDEPKVVTAGDLDGDGRPDLVVANESGGTVSVLRNLTVPGAATADFSSQRIVHAGIAVNSVAIADVNGDGRPDLVASGGGSVSTMINATPYGSEIPTFTAPRVSDAGALPVSISMADINGDGRTDAIVANLSLNAVSVLLNKTQPPTAAITYADRRTFLIGDYPFSVKGADLNGDGKLDLIVASPADGTLSVLANSTVIGSTSPNFALPQNFDVGSFPYSTAIADMNGDGKLDLISANNQDGTVSLLLNTTGLGASEFSFLPQQTFKAGTWSFSLAAADVNGDGRPDLVITDPASAAASVLINTTAPGAMTGTFSAPQAFATGANPYYVATADLNGDGRSDLIIADHDDNTVSVLLDTTMPGAGTPSFAARQTFAVGSGPTAIATADINGDGKRDVVVSNYEGTASVLLNTTLAGAAVPTFATQVIFFAGLGSVFIAPADIDGDGKPDLVVANGASNSLSLLLNTTVTGAMKPTFADQVPLSTGVGPTWVATIDVNGDGRPDLVDVDEHDGGVSIVLSTQYQSLIAGSPATGTIIHDPIFIDGFE